MRLQRVICSFLMAAICLTLLPVQAMATHFRFGHLTWQPTGGNSVEFRFIGAFRRSAYGSLGVGAVFSEFVGGTGLNFGDGAATGRLNFRVLSFDPAADWVVAVALDPVTGDDTIVHTYPSARSPAGPWMATVSGCCRISTLRNGANGSYAVSTSVDLTSGNGSPVSSLVPIIGVPDDSLAMFLVPAADADPNTTLTYRIASSAESGVAPPPNLSINPVTGVVTFDTIATATNPGELWTVQVIIEDRNASDLTIRTTVAIDFLIQIFEDVGSPPECSITPSGPFEVVTGESLSFAVQGWTTVGGRTVTINTGGLPTGAVMTPSLPVSSIATPIGSSVSSTFDWIPGVGDVGTNIVIFSVTDSRGQQVQCSTRIDVIDNRAPEITCNDPVVLWSPNHDLVDVSSAFSVSDPDGDPVTVDIKVYSDESETPETGDGTGKHAPDFKNEIDGGRGLLLRSERAGPGDGRIYLAEITARDGRGGVTTEICVIAVVPHDQDTVSLDAVLTEADAATADFYGNIGSGYLKEHGLAAAAGPKQ